MTTPSPLRIPCEGSDGEVHRLAANAGVCAMCGSLVTCDDEGLAIVHERNDVLGMIDRGDFG